MFKNLKKKKNNKGFTLVELLVVIAIIGVLAVVAVPSLFKQIDKAKATQVVSNIKAIETEVMTEYANGKTVANISTLNPNTLVTDLVREVDDTYAFIASGATGYDAKKVQLKVTSTKNDVLKQVAGQFGNKSSAVTDASASAPGYIIITLVSE